MNAEIREKVVKKEIKDQEEKKVIEAKRARRERKEIRVNQEIVGQEDQRVNRVGKD